MSYNISAHQAAVIEGMREGRHIADLTTVITMRILQKKALIYQECPGEGPWLLTYAGQNLQIKKRSK